MDLESLWKSACSMLENRMNYLAYSTWVQDNMYPVMMEEDTVIISAKMAPLIPMIQKKYLSEIEKCLSEADGKPHKALILSKEEAESRRRKTTPDEDDSNDPHLNPKYTFDSFIPGDSNRFARAAALAAAETPGEAYNPLFIYGGVGLGKTHLMQAIGNHLHQKDPSKRILYMTSETFMNEMINAIQQKKTYELRAKLRMVDLLMVDDIQFIDRETREAILRDKVGQEGIQVPDEVLQLIADKIQSNVRELEGCLTRLTAYSSMTKQPITMELCEVALKEIFDQKQPKKVTAEMIMQTVSDYYSVTLGELTGPTRKREVTVPRQVAIYLTREMTGMSLPQIGEVFGGRDHTTIMHSCKVMENAISRDSSMKNLVNTVKNRVLSAR